MNNKTDIQSKKRIFIALLVIFLLFLVLIARLVVVQIIQASELSEKQDLYMTKKIPITAARGDIYDRNLNIMAMDATCSKISVFPKSVDDPETLADILSEALDMEYNDIIAILTEDTTGSITIKRGVNNEIALQIDEAHYSGIVVSEDSRRYYTNTNFAQYVLGFTGVDHTGLYGIEAEYNTVLSGQDGVINIIEDSTGRQLESTSNLKKEAVAGSDLVLTIDSAIQSFAEDAVYAAYMKNDAKRVVAIVSDPNTGEVLAMAAYPAYDLQDPWSLSKDYLSSYSRELKNLDIGNKQLEMWQNPFTSFIYEPGSTFKVITTSSALEEDIVSLESTYYCPGYLEVSGVKIKCWVYPKGHESEDLTEAVSNSCNVAMMQVAMEMGPDIFYKYIYAYGFGVQTDIDLDGEESGIVSPNENVNIVDFATLSFGQGIGVTPIQMVQALNASINGGELLKPYVVRNIMDHDTDEIVYTASKKVVRQVISEDISVTMRNILKTTADNNPAISRYKDVGLGGKTGTAQKYIGSSYAKGLYVASFYGFAPYDDPKVSVLVLVDEPGGYLTTGGSVAAPIGAEILKNCMNYINSTGYVTTDIDQDSSVTIPDLRGKNSQEAVDILDAMEISYATTGEESGIITDQDYYQTIYKNGMTVTLQITDPSGDQVRVPNLIGMTLQNSNELINALGLTMESTDGGIATKQDVKKGAMVDKGTVIHVEFSYLQ